MKYEPGGTWEENFDGATMQCAGIVENENVIAAAFDEDFNAAKERARRIVACVNFCEGIASDVLTNDRCANYQLTLLKERDALRELCGELIRDIDYAILSINNNFGTTKLLRDAITKAEKALGGNDGNAN